MFIMEWCAASISHVLRFGIKRSPTVPVLPRDGVLLRDSPLLPPGAALMVSLDLDGDTLVFNEAEPLPPEPTREPGAARSLDGDRRRDADRERPDDELPQAPAALDAAAKS